MAGQRLCQTVKIAGIVPQAWGAGFYFIKFYQRLHYNSLRGGIKADSPCSEAFLDGKSIEWYV
jgi:hypothetical protein